jgi:hypothetical protein
MAAAVNGLLPFAVCNPRFHAEEYYPKPNRPAHTPTTQ